MFVGATRGDLLFEGEEGDRCSSERNLKMMKVLGKECGCEEVSNSGYLCQGCKREKKREGKSTRTSKRSVCMCGQENVGSLNAIQVSIK